MNFKYNVVEQNGESTVTVFGDRGPQSADSNHPNFEAIVAGARTQDPVVFSLFNVAEALVGKLETLSERVSFDHNRLYVDNDEIEDAYADMIIGYFQEDDEAWRPLVKFIEKLYTNTEKHTRENLSRWLQADETLTIDEDGDIVGYKGLTSKGGSIHRGPAFVNGESVNGSVENKPGSVITMARSSVDHNPSVGCSVGLHVGTWDYASSFSQGVIAQVKVNPRDVVSVPTDCNGQKMRVSRYKVVKYVDERFNQRTIPSGFVPAEDFKDLDEYSAEYEEGYDEGVTDTLDRLQGFLDSNN